MCKLDLQLTHATIRKGGALTGENLELTAQAVDIGGEESGRKLPEKATMLKVAYGKEDTLPAVDEQEADKFRRRARVPL